MRRLLCAAARRQDRLKEFCIMPVYPMDIAGLHRELPICKVTDDLYIGAFICFGDAELTVACARDMLPCWRQTATTICSPPRLSPSP